MVKITKVYTRKGDRGMTQLAAGKAIAKTSARIAVCGCLDELNAFLGWTIHSLKSHTEFTLLRSQCVRIQNELFNLGAQLVVLPEDKRPNTPKIAQAEVDRLENEIDSMNANLSYLKSFVLPGGSEIACRFHITRTICRRTERALLKLAQEEPLENVEVPYLNRLSDWFFVAARYVTHQLGEEDVLWEH